MVNTLIGNGANVDLANNGGTTPLLGALNNGKLKQIISTVSPLRIS